MPKLTQRLVDEHGVLYATVPVLWGPHEWNVEGYAFQTVCVRNSVHPGSTMALIDTRSGIQLGFVYLPYARLNKRTAQEATARAIRRISEGAGGKRLVSTLQKPPSLPKEVPQPATTTD